MTQRERERTRKRRAIDSPDAAPRACRPRRRATAPHTDGPLSMYSSSCGTPSRSLSRSRNMSCLVSSPRTASAGVPLASTAASSHASLIVFQSGSGCDRQSNRSRSRPIRAVTRRQYHRRRAARQLLLGSLERRFEPRRLAVQAATLPVLPARAWTFADIRAPSPC